MDPKPLHGASKRQTPTAPADPFTAAMRAAFRAELLAACDEGLIGGGDVVPRAAYSIGELAYSIGVSEPLIRRALRDGLPHFRVGASTVRIELAPALAWLREHGDEHYSESAE